MGVRIDELPITLEPTLEHLFAAMHNGQTTQLSVEQIRAVIYDTLEAELGNAARLLTNQVAIARGGTGQDTAAKAYDALWVSGGDVAVAAGTLNLDTPQGVHARITSGATITAITLTAGKHREVDVGAVFNLTASANLIVNGLTAGTFQIRIGDRLFIQGYAAGVVRVWLGRTLNQAGEIAAFAHGTVPDGWVKANGALLSRSTYSALFAAVSTTYSVGDGATTFGIPDLRGEFIRGWADGRAVDTGRSLGSAQSFMMQGHLHNENPTLFPGSASISNGVSGGTQFTTTSGGTITTSAPVSDGTNGTPVVGPETRPRNIALMYCIRY